MSHQIIDPVPVEAIEAELTSEAFLRHTNKGNNDIYVVSAHNAPNTMREIGRCVRSRSGPPAAAQARNAI